MGFVGQVRCLNIWSFYGLYCGLRTILGLCLLGIGVGFGFFLLSNGVNLIGEVLSSEDLIIFRSDIIVELEVFEICGFGETAVQ